MKEIELFYLKTCPYCRNAKKAIAELAALFDEKLHAQIITPLKDCLMDAYWFYGTDNHLSTSGVQLRTRKVIEALKPALEVSE